MAAEASECAAEQNQFWPYHDALFQETLTGNINFTRQRFKDRARALGLDSAAFDQCLDSGRTEDKVIKDMEAGDKLGVRGTPTSYINDYEVVGLPAWESLQGLIEKLLAEAEKR